MIKYLALIALGIFAPLSLAWAQFPPGQVFFTHNSPDASLRAVDVWLASNDQSFEPFMIADDLPFRSGTPVSIFSAPEGYRVVVCEPNGEGIRDSIVSASFNSAQEGVYRVVLQGMRDGNAVVNPDGKPTGLRMLLVDETQLGVIPWQQNDVRFVHGSPDAPSLSFRIPRLGLNVPDLAFNEVSKGETMSLAREDVIELVSSKTGEVIDVYSLPLPFAEGLPYTFILSGLWNAEQKNVQPALYCVDAHGTFVRLRRTFSGPTARVQFINNSLDPYASVNGISITDASGRTEVLQDFIAFPCGTPYFNVPAGQEIDITFAPPPELESLLFTKTSLKTTLDSGVSYIIMQTGVSSESGIRLPDGRTAKLEIVKFDNVANNGSKGVNSPRFISVINGILDSPNLDFQVSLAEEGVANNIGYKEMGSQEILLEQGDQFIRLVESSSRRVLGTYVIPSFWAAANSVFLATGTLDTLGFGNLGHTGNTYTLIGLAADGLCHIFAPAGDSAHIQFIHGSPDPVVEKVDIYVNGEKVANDLPFEEATPYLNFAANRPFTITIADSRSERPGDGALKSFNFPLVVGGSAHVFMLVGVTKPQEFNFRVTEDRHLDLIKLEGGGRAVPENGHVVECAIANLCPDSEGFRFDLDRHNMVVNDLQFRQSRPHNMFAAVPIYMEVDDATGTERMATFTMDLTPHLGKTGVLAVTGLAGKSRQASRTPLTFSMYMADGSAVRLSGAGSGSGSTTSADDANGLNAAGTLKVFPNPATAGSTLTVTAQFAGFYQVSVIDQLGREVQSISLGQLSGNENRDVELDLTQVPAGMYTVRLGSESMVSTTMIAIVK